MRTKYLSLLLSIIMIIVVLAGCGNSTTSSSNADTFEEEITNLTYEELVEKAKEEGEVIVYTPNPDERFDSVVNAFEEEYGIKVRHTQVNGGDLANRVNAEYDSGNVQVDVIQQTDDVILNDFKDKGYLLKVDKFVIPEVTNQANELITDGYLSPVAYATVGIIYDSTRIEDPKSWEDLLDPELKGQVGMTDPAHQNVFVSVLSSIRDNYGDEFLKKLNQQVITYQDHSLVANMVMGKELLAGITTAGTAMSLINAQQSSDIKFTTDLGFTIGTPMSQVLSEGGSNHYAGLLFMNWTYSPEGQQLLNGGGMAATPLEGVEIEGVSPVPEGFIPADYAGAIEKRDEILEIFQGN